MSRRAPGRAAEIGVGGLDDHRFERGPVDVHVVRRDRQEDRLALAVLAQEVEAELEVRALQVAIDGLADVVEEGRAGRHLAVEAQLLRHDAGEERDFLRVVQDVLPVAGAELQSSHQPQHFGMQVEEPELEGGGFAFAADRLLHVRLHLLDDLLDPRRMDAAVGDETLDRLARDLAAERIEAGEDDRARRVVDDQLDAGGGFERADVAAFAADDPALQVVARQIDDRDGGLDGVFGGAALDRVGDDLLRAARRGLAGFGLEALDHVGGVAPRVGFHLLQQHVARFVGREAGDSLQLALAIGDQLLGARQASAVMRSCAASRFSRPRGPVRGGRSSDSRSASARVLSASACSRARISCRRSRSLAARPRRRARAPFRARSSAASLRSVSASRSACLQDAACGADSRRLLGSRFGRRGIERRLRLCARRSRRAGRGSREWTSTGRPEERRRDEHGPEQQ